MLRPITMDVVSGVRRGTASLSYRLALCKTWLLMPASQVLVRIKPHSCGEAPDLMVGAGDETGDR